MGTIFGSPVNKIKSKAVRSGRKQAFSKDLFLFSHEHILSSMEQVNRRASRGVLLAMVEADLGLDQLAELLGIPTKTLVQRIATGRFTIEQLAVIAASTGRLTHELLMERAA